jgi:hypothetical protein
MNINSATRCVRFMGAFYAIGNNWIYYTSDILGTVWIKVHQIYPDEKDPRGSSLGLMCTLGNQQGTYHLTVTGADRDIWSPDGKIWHDQQLVKSCTCDMKTILCKGCQCGGA